MIPQSLFAADTPVQLPATRAIEQNARRPIKTWNSRQRRSVRRMADPGGQGLAQERSEPAEGAESPIWVIGTCNGFIFLRPEEVADYYRGYALVGLPAVVLALMTGIVCLVTGTLPW